MTPHPVAEAEEILAFPTQRAREAAHVYAGAAPVPDDEFLSWYLGLTRGGDLAGAKAGYVDTPAVSVPRLPDLETVARQIQGWSLSDASFARLLQETGSKKIALTRWGARLLQSDQAVLATEAFCAATALTPADAGSWSNLGVCLDVLGALDLSAACLEYSVSLKRAQVDTWLQLGTVRNKQHDSAAAERAFRTALQLEPRNALAWQCLGLLKEEQKDFPAAIDCFLSCLRNGLVNAALCANIGRLCYRIGRFVPAHLAYSDASQQEPDNDGFRSMARKLGFICAVLEGADVDVATAPLQAQPDELQDILTKSFGILAGFGHHHAALKVGRRSLELWPDQPGMAYLTLAMEGGGGLQRSPREYLVEHFDRFAETFDSQLVGALGYDAPEKMDRLLRQAMGPVIKADILDAGCGTGLCGPFLRKLARRLVGLDISSGMLACAEERGMYDQLVEDDLIRYLGRSPRGFDVISAADVLIYFGDLGPVMASAAYALRKGGYFIFSIETQPGDGYRLRASGRFSHAVNYVLHTAEPEFALVTSEATTLRQEAEHRVAGHLFVFRRL